MASSTSGDDIHALREALDTTSDGVTIFDREWHYVYANRRAASYTDFSATDLIGRRLWDVFPGVRESSVFREYQHSLAEQLPAVFEHRAVTFGRWFEHRLMPSPRGLTVFTSDITARKQAEQAYRSLVEQSLQGLAIVQDGRMVFVNQTLARMIGYTPQELLALSPAGVAGIMHEEDRARILERMAARLAGQDLAAHFECRFVRKDGSILWVESSGMVIEYDRAPALQIALLDVTERRRAEEARREAGVVWAALARVGEVLLASFDTPALPERLCEVTAQVLGCASSHTFLWRADDEAFAPVAAHGVAPEEWESTRVLHLPREAAGEVLRRLADDGVTEQVAPRHSGELDLSVLLHVPAGAAVLYLALRRADELVGVQTAALGRPGERFSPSQLRIARGIAQLASMALEHARIVDELDRANRLKSEFVAMISHELRTPLNAIIGYADLLHEGVFGEVSSAQDEALRGMRRASHELLRLIEDVLDLSRLESGRVSVDLRPTSIPELLAELEAELDELRAGSPVAVLVEVAPDLAAVRTDPAKLKAVVKNLATNALKFTDDGRVRLSARRRDAGVEIAVADTGVGISPEHLEIIFEPFRQADGTSTRRHGGVGLGLHIVRRLVGVLGGRVAVESTLGQGSTFRIWIPDAPK